jgi:hypothetical protein
MKDMLRFLAPLLMAGAAATAIAAAPVSAAEDLAIAASASSITIPASPGGDGCTTAGCGNGGPNGGSGCNAQGVCGGGGPGGGGGCNAQGVCGSGGPGGGGGCAPGIGCFHYGQ